MSGCSGPCQQGRHPCPTPEACRNTDDLDPYMQAFVEDVIMSLVAFAVASVAIIYLLEWVL